MEKAIPAWNEANLKVQSLDKSAVAVLKTLLKNKDKRLEIIKSYTRNENNECITDYESVTFVNSVLPSPSAALNVVAISLLAASSPLLLGLLKSISKTVFKKAITKKDKTNFE